MVKRRIGFRWAGLFALAAFIWSGAALPQAFPRQPIRVIVPFAPGSSTDTLGMLAQRPERAGQAGWAIVVPSAGQAVGPFETPEHQHRIVGSALRVPKILT